MVATVSSPLQSLFGWLSSVPSLLFGQKEPAGTKSDTGYSQGIDLPLNLDTPIGNIMSGTVVGDFYAPWGGQVDVESVVNGVNTVTEYLHLDQIKVALGQTVQVGTLIGLSGGQLSGGSHPATSQFSTGPHIKFSEFVGATQAQINAGQWGQAIDPSQLLASASQMLSTNPGGPIGVPGGSGTENVGSAAIGALFGGAANATQLFSNIVGYVASANFLKIVIGGILVLIAILLFLIPGGVKVVDTVAPLAALAG